MNRKTLLFWTFVMPAVLIHGASLAQTDAVDMINAIAAYDANCPKMIPKVEFLVTKNGTKDMAKIDCTLPQIKATDKPLKDSMKRKIGLAFLIAEQGKLTEAQIDNQGEFRRLKKTVDEGIKLLCQNARPDLSSMYQGIDNCTASAKKAVMQLDNENYSNRLAERRAEEARKQKELKERALEAKKATENSEGAAAPGQTEPGASEARNKAQTPQGVTIGGIKIPKMFYDVIFILMSLTIVGMVIRYFIRPRKERPPATGMVEERPPHLAQYNGGPRNINETQQSPEIDLERMLELEKVQGEVMKATMKNDVVETGPGPAPTAGGVSPGTAEHAAKNASGSASDEGAAFGNTDAETHDDAPEKSAGEKPDESEKSAMLSADSDADASGDNKISKEEQLVELVRYVADMVIEKIGKDADAALGRQGDDAEFKETAGSKTYDDAGRTNIVEKLETVVVRGLKRELQSMFAVSEAAEGAEADAEENDADQRPGKTVADQLVAAVAQKVRMDMKQTPDEGWLGSKDISSIRESLNQELEDALRPGAKSISGGGSGAASGLVRPVDALVSKIAGMTAERTAGETIARMVPRGKQYREEHPEADGNSWTVGDQIAAEVGKEIGPITAEVEKKLRLIRNGLRDVMENNTQQDMKRDLLITGQGKISRFIEEYVDHGREAFQAMIDAVAEKEIPEVIVEIVRARLKEEVKSIIDSRDVLELMNTAWSLQTTNILVGALQKPEVQSKIVAAADAGLSDAVAHGARGEIESILSVAADKEKENLTRIAGEELKGILANRIPENLTDSFINMRNQFENIAAAFHAMASRVETQIERWETTDNFVRDKVTQFRKIQTNLEANFDRRVGDYLKMLGKAEPGMSKNLLLKRNLLQGSNFEDALNTVVFSRQSPPMWLTDKVKRMFKGVENTEKTARRIFHEAFLAAYPDFDISDDADKIDALREVLRQASGSENDVFKVDLEIVKVVADKIVRSYDLREFWQKTGEIYQKFHVEIPKEIRKQFDDEKIAETDFEDAKQIIMWDLNEALYFSVEN